MSDAVLITIAAANGGLITRQQALMAGIPPRRLTDLVRRGYLARVARGVYSPASTLPPNPAVVTAGLKVVLSCESAAAWWGVDLPAPVERVHVSASLTRGRWRDEVSGVVLHRARLGADDVVVVRGVRTTTPVRTALDVARRCSLEHAVAIIDAFFRSRLLSATDFLQAARQVQGPGRVRVQLVARLVDPKSGSILESLTRVLMWRAQLPTAQSQYALRDARNRWIGRIDFAWPALRVLLECDGYEFHASAAQFQRDRRRWTAATRAGWQCLVVTWFDVTRDANYVVGALREVLGVSAPHPASATRPTQFTARAS